MYLGYGIYGPTHVGIKCWTDILGTPVHECAVRLEEQRGLVPKVHYGDMSLVVKGNTTSLYSRQTFTFSALVLRKQECWCVVYINC